MKFLQALFQISHSCLDIFGGVIMFSLGGSRESEVSALYNETFLSDHSSNVIDGSRVAKGVGVLDPASMLGIFPRDNSPAAPFLTLSLQDLQQHGHT